MKIYENHLNANDFNLEKHTVFDNNSSTHQKQCGLHLIAGDASDRKFYRLIDKNGHNVAICMEFPKWEGGYGGDPVSWLGMQAALEKIGIPVPKIYAINENQRCIWTEDLGDIFLSNLKRKEILDITDTSCQESIKYYKKSLQLLINAAYPNVAIDCPASTRFFNFEKLFYELEFFVTHFINGFLQLGFTRENNHGLFSDFEKICHELNTCEKVLCHRDYHVRNIMVHEKKLYWIDFQDARMGPHSYDVVSLLRDSYVKMTWKTRKDLFTYYLNELNEKRKDFSLKIICQNSMEHEFSIMGLQRNIKAIGSFGYLATIKNKKNYLNYVNDTLETILAPEATAHQEINLKNDLPNLFKLLNDLRYGQYNNRLNSKISEAMRLSIETQK